MGRKAGKRKHAGSQASTRESTLQQRLQQQPKARTQNKLAQAQSRWQRTVRYVWDKKRG